MYLPSNPIRRRFDVKGPHFCFFCWLDIHNQLKPRKSTTICLPTVSFNCCCKYILKKKSQVYMYYNDVNILPQIHIRLKKALSNYWSQKSEYKFSGLFFVIFEGNKSHVSMEKIFLHGQRTIPLELNLWITSFYHQKMPKKQISSI